MTTAGTAALVFAVSLLVGGFAIAIGARAALKSEDYSHAVLTALLGALAWAAVDAVFTQLGAGGALASLVVPAVLALAGVGALDAYGVPGT